MHAKEDENRLLYSETYFKVEFIYIDVGSILTPILAFNIVAIDIEYSGIYLISTKTLSIDVALSSKKTYKLSSFLFRLSIGLFSLFNNFLKYIISYLQYSYITECNWLDLFRFIVISG